MKFTTQIVDFGFILETISDGSETSPIWLYWKALANNWSDFGIIESAFMTNGEKHKISLEHTPEEVIVYPLRNFTPYPITALEKIKNPGKWLFDFVIEASSNIAFNIQIKIFDSSDEKGLLLFDCMESSRYTKEINIPFIWNKIQIRKTKGKNLQIRVIEFTAKEININQIWKLCSGSSKPEHKFLNVEKNGNLVFENPSECWSYFTCKLIPY